MGFVRSLRRGDTGIGFTIETLLNIPENNRGEPDCFYKGVAVELKAQRAETTSMITLFTKEPEKGIMNDVRLIRRYGYPDVNGRPALKVTLTTRALNPQGLGLSVDRERGVVNLIDREGSKPWHWPIVDLRLKIQNLVLILAETRTVNGVEFFRIKEGYFLGELDAACFFRLIDEAHVVVDLRMHLRPNGVARNHGTAFRTKSLAVLLPCYRHHERLL
jgi:hypothetical protein